MNNYYYNVLQTSNIILLTLQVLQVLINGLIITERPMDCQIAKVTCIDYTDLAAKSLRT